MRTKKLALDEQIAFAKQAHREKTHERLMHRKSGGQYIKDIVLGANDGIITTFAVVSGVTGADLSSAVVLILGVANLLADAISMAIGNYLGSKSEEEYLRSQRKLEEWEVQHLPEEEIEEIRDIYRNKGFEGSELDRVVEVITSNQKLWVDVMLREELRLADAEEISPIKSGLSTFVSFVLAGVLPLLPYLFSVLAAQAFQASMLMTGLALFGVGAARTFITRQSWWRSGLGMLGVGALAAAVAYGVGYFLKSLIGI